jgi:hypothetical protein
MHETPSRDRGYGRATGQPSRGTAGLGSEAHFFSTSQGELVLSLPKEHPRTPGVRLCKTGGRRRQGSLRRNAHPEPPPSFGQRKASRAFHHIPPKGPGSVSTISAATMRLCNADLPAANHPIAAGNRAHSVLPHRAYSSARRTAMSAVAAGDSCIARAREPASARHALPLRSTVRALDDKRWRSLGRRVTRRAEKLLASVDPSRYNPFRLGGTNGRLAPYACIRGKAYEQEVF